MKRARLMLIAFFGPAVAVACGLDLVGQAPVAKDADASIRADGGGTIDDGSSPSIDDAGADGAGPDASTCPVGKGPSMVDIGGTCVDRTEVTEEQYAAFLASGPVSPAGVCSWKSSYQPFTSGDCKWDPAKYPNLPVVCVDWCDAFAFCKWAGKRLCGKIGGGAVAWAGGEDVDAAKDQWFRACTGGGMTKYPYGNSVVPDACRSKEVSETRGDAGSLPTCEGGYPGLFDMVGNVLEQEDSCDGDAGANDKCKLRSGSWFYKETDALNSCAGVYSTSKRGDHYDDTGFRCCSP